jgi:hypothetical protein
MSDTVTVAENTAKIFIFKAVGCLLCKHEGLSTNPSPTKKKKKKKKRKRKEKKRLKISILL